MKNKIKSVYGSHSFTNYDEKQEKEGEALAQDECIDEQGKQVLMNELVNLMLHFSGKHSVLCNLVLEMIALMSRKYVQKEWPQLFPALIN